MNDTEKLSLWAMTYTRVLAAILMHTPSREAARAIAREEAKSAVRAVDDDDDLACSKAQLGFDFQGRQR